MATDRRQPLKRVSKGCEYTPLCCRATLDDALAVSASSGVSPCPIRGPILVGMTRRLFNWEYADVIQFLKEHGFEFYEPHRGSHERWAKVKEDGTTERVVEVNRSHSAYPPKTLKRMINRRASTKTTG